VKKNLNGEYVAQLRAKGGLPVHFLQLLAVWLPLQVLVTLPNIHRLKKSLAQSAIHFPLNLVIDNPITPHLIHVATLPCNLSLIGCYLTLTFRKVTLC